MGSICFQPQQHVNLALEFRTGCCLLADSMGSSRLVVIHAGFESVQNAQNRVHYYSMPPSLLSSEVSQKVEHVDSAAMEHCIDKQAGMLCSKAHVELSRPKPLSLLRVRNTKETQPKSPYREPRWAHIFIKDTACTRRPSSSCFVIYLVSCISSWH